MSHAQPYAVCIDIGGSKALIGFVNRQGKITARERCIPEPNQSPGALVAMLARHARELADREGIGWDQVCGVGYSTAGMMDVESGIIFASPNQGTWRDVPYKAILQDAFSLPAWIEMDANAAALGEAWLGAGANKDYFVLVIVGTGIGAGILLNGQIMRGWRGTAGEFGHTIIDLLGPLCNCGRYGCLESLASGPAIAQRALAASQAASHINPDWMTGKQIITATDVFEAARAGDHLAHQVVNDTVHYLAVGLSNLVHLLNPQAIALGGGVAVGAADLLIEPLRRETFRLCGSWVDTSSLMIETARLGEDAGLLGAARLVWRNVGNA